MFCGTLDFSGTPHEEHCSTVNCTWQNRITVMQQKSFVIAQQ